MAVDTIPSRLFAQARRRPEAPAHFRREGGIWKGTGWAGYAREVEQAGRALIALGFEPGQTVSILGFNCPEWVILDVACMAAGGAPAGVYTTSSSDEVRYIVDHAESPVVLVENEEQWRKIEAERHHMPKLRHVVTMRDSPRIDDPLVMSWEQFLARGHDVPAQALFDRLEALREDDVATLIYTSGTTGPPKGVMLSHRNLAWTADVAVELAGVTSEERLLSYLPLSHIAEQMFTIHAPITMGAQVYFAESIDRVQANLREVRPTIFFGVPRLWEKLQTGIRGKLEQASGVKKRLGDWAMSVGKRVHELRSEQKEVPRPLQAQYRLAQRLVYGKVKAAVGLDAAKICVSGAAPIAPEVLWFLAGLDLVVLEVYGQSEGSGPTSFNRPERYKLGTVGPPIPGVDVHFAEDGEVLLRGPNVFLGYYKDETATRETLIDGWLHSGDLGYLDAQGFLRISGRKKDILITAGGKNITPKNIEHAIKKHPLVGEAVVVGDRRRYLSALLTVDPDALEQWAKEHGVPPAQARGDARLHAEMQKAVDDANQHFARVEQVKRFRILPRNLSLDDGELTPTLKIKRNVVYQHFKDEIEAMYAE